MVALRDAVARLVLQNIFSCVVAFALICLVLSILYVLQHCRGCVFLKIQFMIIFVFCSCVDQTDVDRMLINSMLISTMWIGCGGSETASVGDTVSFRSGGGAAHAGEFIHTSCNAYKYGEQNSITARPGFGGLPRYAWLCEGDGGDMVVLPTPPPTASPSIASIEDQAQLEDDGAEAIRPDYAHAMLAQVVTVVRGGPVAQVELQLERAGAIAVGDVQVALHTAGPSGPGTALTSATSVAWPMSGPTT